MANAVISPANEAPMKNPMVLYPTTKKATRIPGKTACDKASPINDIFRNTIKHPKVPNMTPTKEDAIMARMKSPQKPTPRNAFNIDLLETDRIYHVDQIREICVDYRLRFLDTKYFKNEIPQEALHKIKQLEKDHEMTLRGFKIVAPSKMFKLENADDPLLFAPIGNGYFYLIHKWGNDLNFFRKAWAWPFKSLENLIVCTLLVSLVAAYAVPNGIFSKDTSGVQFVLIFFFIPQKQIRRFYIKLS